MSREANNSAALTSNNDASPSAGGFCGFEPLLSNYVFCPNQFFDVCLKSKSRGMVRTVAFILRQSLGWLDSEGQPINETIKVSFQRLIDEAGVSRGAITKAIHQAQACGFIDCVVAPLADQKGNAGSTGEYQLRWDDSEAYKTAFSEFDGFFALEGNRSPIPNSFFDVVIPTESLAVIKVVGAVIRHTVGYTTQFGRRSSSPLSCTTLQTYTGIGDRKTIIAAISHALKAGYITRVEEGKFSPFEKERRPAVYAVRWLCKKQTRSTSTKTPPARNQFKNPTNTSSKTPPADRYKNPTSIEKKKTKDISKQQTVVVEFLAAVNRLIETGFGPETANAIVEKRGVDIVERQLMWIDARKPKNRVGLLRKAIEEDWDEPEAFRVNQKIKESRIRATENEVFKHAQEAKLNEQKRIRIERKKRLLKVWENASLDDRVRWIEAAVETEKTTIMRNIIRRTNPMDIKPHFQVLDELANNEANVANASTQ